MLPLGGVAHAVKARPPPDRSTRRASAIARPGRGKCSMPKAQVTASKLAASKGSASASPRRKSIPGQASRAIATMSDEKSMPTGLAARVRASAAT